MYKSKTRLIVFATIILIIYTIFLGFVYAKNSEVSDRWGVTITSDAKELSEIREIKFKVENNNNVVSGKIAPGLTAVSRVDVNLEKVNGKVDVMFIADRSELDESEYKLTAYIDDEIYNFGELRSVDSGKTVEIRMELEWMDSENNITQINEEIEELKIPIKIKVSQNV